MADGRRDNCLSLRACIVERGALRYTPAGLPAIDLVLRYEGEAVEANKPRRVVLDLKTKAIGEDLVQQVQAIGGDAVCTGFLAAARNGRGVVFHLQAITAADAPDDHR